MPIDAPEGRLRLTVLGGYLGSGKTTWLRHQRHAGTFGPNVHVIVNEAAETPVDDALLGQVTLLAGGCCCCSGRPALIAALRHWPSEGIPRNPAAWLMVTGKRRAIDHFRRTKMLKRIVRVERPYRRVGVLGGG